VDDALKRDFDVRRTTPVTLVTTARPGPALDRHLDAVLDVPGVLEVGPPRREGPRNCRRWSTAAG
jgi:hypothetical protein